MLENSSLVSELDAGSRFRLADEYDAAQERGEILANGERTFSSPEKVKGTEVIPPKELHEARLIRDAEVVGAHDGAKNRVLKENAIPTSADIGLSRKADNSPNAKVSHSDHGRAVDKIGAFAGVSGIAAVSFKSEQFRKI